MFERIFFHPNFVRRPPKQRMREFLAVTVMQAKNLNGSEGAMKPPGGLTPLNVKILTSTFPLRIQVCPKKGINAI